MGKISYMPLVPLKANFPIFPICNFSYGKCQKQQGVNPMANHGYMTINGKSQGLISANCSTQDSIGNKWQDGHRDEIMVLSFQHNMANRGNIWASSHGPIAITKNIDKSSPLLAVALSNREELNCVINFYRISPSGRQEKYYSVDIRGCIITDLTVDVPILFCILMPRHKSMSRSNIAK